MAPTPPAAPLPPRRKPAYYTGEWNHPEPEPPPSTRGRRIAALAALGVLLLAIIVHFGFTDGLLVVAFLHAAGLFRLSTTTKRRIPVINQLGQRRNLW